MGWRPHSVADGCQDIAVVFDPVSAGVNCTEQCASKTLTIVGITQGHVQASSSGPCDCIGVLTDPFAGAQTGALLQLVGPQGAIGTVVNGDPAARVFANAVDNFCRPPGGTTNPQTTSCYAGPDLFAPLQILPTAGWSGAYPFLVVIVAPCSAEGLAAQVTSLSSVMLDVCSQGVATSESYLALLSVSAQISCCDCGTSGGNPDPGVFP